MVYIPPGCPWDNGYIESFNRPTTQGVPEPELLEHPVRSPRGHRRLQGRPQPPTPPLGPGLPHTGRVRCGVQVHPHPGGLQHQLRTDQTNPSLEPGGLSNGDSPGCLTCALIRSKCRGCKASYMSTESDFESHLLGAGFISRHWPHLYFAASVGIRCSALHSGHLTTNFSTS